jgi:signal transduction histidine kinase
VSARVGIRPARAATAEAPAALSAAGQRARILLVDDDERNLLALSEVLNPIAETVTAASGRDALRELLDGEFAVILLDVFMPGMDGYETASLIRQRAQTSKIPIIFLSAVNKETEHLMRGYTMGAVDYVFKPVDPVVLKAKVSVFVDLFLLRQQIGAQAEAERELREAKLIAEQERLRFERELQQTQLRQAAILEALPLALYEASVDGEGRLRRRLVGGDTAKLAGSRADSLLSGELRWEDAIVAEDALGLDDRLRNSDTSSLVANYRWRGDDGQIIHVLDQCVPQPGSDGLWVGTLIDVTTQRELEEQLVQARKMEALGQLTGGIAHDFNNVLAAVLGGVRLLERRVALEAREQGILEQMRHAAEQGAALVKRLMAFARKQDLSPAAAEPEQVCQAVGGILAHTLGSAVAVEWTVDTGDACFHVDRAQLELALVNLLINARDAMPNGGTIAVRMKATEDEWICITVHDEGTGIPPELIAKVTEPFFTTKSVGKGTGLGLSMVAGFVQQSGGRFDIASTPGEGTVIEMLLPAVPRGQAGPAHSGDELAESALRVRSVLVVDDENSVRTVVSEHLRDLGLEVFVAADGAEALRILAEAEIDFVLTDYSMPGQNGLELLAAAQGKWPSLQAAIMTGNVEGALAELSTSDVNLILKPIDFAQLDRLLSH